MRLSPIAIALLLCSATAQTTFTTQLLPSFKLTVTMKDPATKDIDFVFEGTASVAGVDQWYSIGFGNTAVMASSDMIMCTPTSCTSMTTPSYETPKPQPTSSLTTPTLISLSGGVRKWSFKRVHVGSMFTLKNEDTWTIYAFGNMNGATTAGHGQGPDNRFFKQINFFTGTVTSLTETKLWLYALGVLLLFVIACAAGAKQWNKGNCNTPMMQGLVILGFVCVLLLWIAMNFADYNSIEAKVPGLRAVGHGVVMCLALQFLPALRKVTPFAFERSVMFHGALGIACYATMTAHGIGMLATYGMDYVINNFALLSGLLCWITCTLLIFIGILARRAHYEFFQMTHLPLAAVTINFAIAHYEPLWKFMLPGIILLLLDFAVRYYNTTRCSISRIDRRPTFTAIIFGPTGGNPLAFTGSQFGLFCVPAVSIRQFHPFSIMPCPTAAGQAMIFVKTMGKGTFTNDLNTAAKPSVGDTLILDGPHGRLAQDPHSFEKLILISGGVGVTPMLSFIMSFGPLLRKEQCIVFVWSVREMDLLQYVQAVLGSAIGKVQCQLEINIYYTGQSQSLPTGVNKGRPDYEKLIQKADAGLQAGLLNNGGAASESKGVFICGPGALGDTVQTLCIKYGVDFHREVFEF